MDSDSLGGTGNPSAASSRKSSTDSQSVCSVGISSNPLARSILTKVIQSLPSLACVLDIRGNIICCNTEFDILIDDDSSGSGSDSYPSFLAFVAEDDRLIIQNHIIKCFKNTEKLSPILLKHRNGSLSTEWNLNRLMGIENDNFIIANGNSLKRRPSRILTGNTYSINNIFDSNNAQLKSPIKATTNRPARSPSIVSTLKNLWKKKSNKRQNYSSKKIHVEPEPVSQLFHQVSSGSSFSVCDDESASEIVDFGTLQKFGEEQIQRRMLQQTKAHYMNKIESVSVETKALQHTLEVKRIFVKAVAHEIRTPLNIILSGLNLLEMEYADNSALQVTIQDMKFACVTSIDIVSDFLTYEKLDSDICKLQKEIIDVRQVLEDAMKPFHVQARYCQIVLQYEDLLSEILFVNADAYKLHQVFRNLISNAIKFSKPKSTVTVRLSSLLLTKQQRQSSQTTYQRIEVIDQGAGISIENQARLFGEIIQFNSKELQAGGGSGIGLWVSKKLVDAHGGSIGVVSKGEGSGCTFFVDLPVSELPQLQGHKKQDLVVQSFGSSDDLTAEPNRGMLGVVGRKLSDYVENDYFNGRSIPHILIVDDSLSPRKMTTRLLTKVGITISEAADGLECLQVVAEKTLHIDVILMDFNMSNMNGPVATLELRKSGFSGKIFGVTGDCCENARNAFVTAGADRVFVKPLTEACLMSIIDLL